MLKLHTKSNLPIGRVSLSAPAILRVTENPSYPEALRSRSALRVNQKSREHPQGFGAYLVGGDLSLPDTVENAFRTAPELDYLSEGDVIKVSPSGAISTIYRRHANVNFLLVTERCNSFCVMCSQPPRDVDDDYLIDDYLRAIRLFDQSTPELMITGGEPTLLGDRFVGLVRSIKSFLPRTAIHVLTNGRNFKDLSLCARVAAVDHPDIMYGIPIYSDVPAIHDFVVQADGAFDETTRGILNLKRHSQRVELRVVVHKYTSERLEKLATFIVRNLQFVDHVALMGLEPTGFGKSNYTDLWIDPIEYQGVLSRAVTILDRAGIRTSIYNHQLCVLSEAVRKFAVKSISDWKREYLGVCRGCAVLDRCGGFFSSALERHSDHIRPLSVA